jgi:uncharacterized protein (DUF2345 family)
VKSKSGDITITTPAKIDMNSTGDDISVKTPTNITIDAGGNITIHAKGNIDITADGNMSLKAGGKMSLESGAAMSMLAGSSMSLEAKNIAAKASAADIALDGATAIGLTSIKIDMAAKAQLNATAAQVSIDGSATTSVSAGGALTLEASGITSVSGSILKLN